MPSDNENRHQDAQEGPRSDPGALNDAGALTRIADALEAIVGLLERRLAVDEATAEFTSLLKMGMSGTPPEPDQASAAPYVPFEDYQEGPVAGTYEVFRDGQWEPASARDQREIASVQASRRGRR